MPKSKGMTQKQIESEAKRVLNYVSECFSDGTAGRPAISRQSNRMLFGPLERQQAMDMILDLVSDAKADL